LSTAERQRRRRAHLRGDHSLCDPDRRDCHNVTSPDPVTATADVTPPEPDLPDPDLDMPDLGRGGRRMWRELTAEKRLTPAERVLVEEACRIKDRCDRFERLMRGNDDVWGRVTLPDGEGTELVLTIDRLVSEARMQGLALKQVLSELRQARTGAAAPGVSASPAAPASGGGTVAGGGGGGIGTILDLAKAIDAKRRATTQG
jgi:hypothetical protein